MTDARSSHLERQIAFHRRVLESDGRELTDLEFGSLVELVLSCAKSRRYADVLELGQKLVAHLKFASQLKLKEQVLDLCLDAAKELGNQRGLVQIQVQMGVAHAEAGNRRQARVWLNRALARAESPEARVEALRQLARLEGAEKAVERLKEAHELARASSFGAGAAALDLGRALLDGNDPEGAEAVLRGVLETLNERDRPEWACEARVLLADALRLRHHDQQAQELYLTSLREVGETARCRGDALAGLTRLALDRGDAAAARIYGAQAAAFLVRAGQVEQLEDLKLLLG